MAPVAMTRPWRLIAAGVVSVLLTGPGSASASPGKTVVVFTVDVETNEAFRLPDQIDAVCADGSACGLMEIVRLLQERRWPGTYFLNVYEHRQWGDAAMRDIVRKLQRSGNDVELHTHPQWAYDPARNAMYQYDLEEQTAIVRDGVTLLREWTGRPVVAHRAGDYSADQRTLEALRRNGISVDSSLFFGHPRCLLNGLGLPRNLPSLLNDVVQIPVTVYQRDAQPQVLGEGVAPISSFRKIDPDWFVDVDEANRAIDAIVDADIPYLVVFMHSFSFLSGRGGMEAPATNAHSLGTFRAMLRHIEERRLPAVTMRDIAESREAIDMSSRPDVSPRVTINMPLHHYAWRRLRAFGAGPLVACSTILTMTAVGVLCVVIRRRRSAGAAGQHTRHAHRPEVSLP